MIIDPSHRGFSCVVVVAALLVGCAQPPPPAALSVTWTLAPIPPTSGRPTTARLTIVDARQQPVHGATLQLEGRMAHDMPPVRVPLTEVGDGVYEADLQFTMAGDWTLVVTGTTSGGEQVSEQVEVPSVRAQEAS